MAAGVTAWMEAKAAGTALAPAWAWVAPAMPAVVCAAIGVVGVLLLVNLWTAWVRYRSGGMPGPSFWWLFGHLNDFHTASVSLATKYGGIYNMFMGNRTMAVVSDPELLRQLLSDTETFPKIPFKEIVTSKRLNDFLGVGFLGLNGKEWWAVKKHFAGAFHFSAMEPLVPVFHARSIRLLQALVPASERNQVAHASVASCNGPPSPIGKPGFAPQAAGFDVDVKRWMSRLSLDVLGHTMFGQDLGAVPADPAAPSSAAAQGTASPQPPCKCVMATGADSPMMEAYDCFFDSIGDVRTAMLPNYDAWPFVCRHSKCLPSSLALLNDLILSTIRRHEEELDEREAAAGLPAGLAQDDRASSGSRHSAHHDDAGGDQAIAAAAKLVVEQQRRLQAFGPTNLLHSMIHTVRAATKAGQPPPLSREDLRANVLTFFIAGHDTTSSALSWAVYYLATEPAVQQLLRAEVSSREPWKPLSVDEARAWSRGDAVRRPATYEDVKRGAMPYMDAFISEVLRIRPPLGNFLTRKASRDTTLGGFTIRKGQFVSPSVFNVHHDPAIWDQPDTFDPTRFLAPSKRHAYAYIPFLMGKRKCIGSIFSLLEQRVFLAELVTRFTILPPQSCNGEVTDGPAPHVAFYSPRRVTVRLVPRSQVGDMSYRSGECGDDASSTTAGMM